MHIPSQVSHAPPSPAGALDDLRGRIRSQPFRDKLYVAGVLVLVAFTLCVAVGYGVHEWPRWRAGDLGGFDTTVLPLPGQSGEVASGQAIGPDGSASPTGGLNRTTLILTSMLIEAAIFVGLGLYLRHEMNQKP